MDERDRFDRDDDLEAMLRQHADRLTGPLDTDGALQSVQRRARTRRRWRAAASTLAAAAAVIVVVAGGGALLGDDRQTVRTPAAPVDATATSAAPTLPVSPVPAPTSTVTTLPPSAPPTSAPAVPTSPPPPVSTTAPAAAASPPAPTQPPAPPTSTTTSTTVFSSTGGTITIRRAGGTIALDSAPTPAPGWSYRVDDDGPTRVRVRFERDGQRSEIRVDLEGGALVPEIIEQ